MDQLTAFGGGQKGIEACHAIAALCEGHDVSGENGRIHCSLNINTETGRLSARRPNLQNQPALEKDRYKFGCFCSCREFLVIVVDYGQDSWAHLANCKSMLAAFRAGGDFHSRTAMNMYPHIREAVEKGSLLSGILNQDAFGSERRKAKMLNFSIAYGKTTIGLSRDWKVSVKEAKETVERRACWFPSVKNATGSVKGHIERAATNTPVQFLTGKCCRCRYVCHVREIKECTTKGAWMEIAFTVPVDCVLLQVAISQLMYLTVFAGTGSHEVILEGPEESEKEAMAIVVDCMSNPFDGKTFSEFTHLLMLNVPKTASSCVLLYGDLWVYFPCQFDAQIEYLSIMVFLLDKSPPNSSTLAFPRICYAMSKLRIFRRNYGSDIRVHEGWWRFKLWEQPARHKVTPMSRELDSKTSASPTPVSRRYRSPTVCSFAAGDATSPKRTKPRTSIDQASSSWASEDNKNGPEIVRKAKHYNCKTPQIPILESENISVDGTPY
ncbi:DNA polymerase I B, chloroplastic/mitochondrial [Datura stramonium]|uniref:DNA polymerase I B, chloroplastic/mitochondrial n=1 Tax=Datura stramonium TaxID=4076 RepID=A0ABS8SUA0_DATST|nr:DNA polymerase I B, chloroplastic/mitochondrial [Datura stramonium]